jgi:hypothetical protein
MKPLFFSILTLVFLSSCAILEEQGSYLHGAKLKESTKTIELLSDKSFEQSRGVLGDTYYAKAGKGRYDFVFETKAGEFYFANDVDFECEDFYVGGLFYSKTKGEIYLWTMPMFNKEKALKKLKKEKYLKRINKGITARKPFIHSYYVIQKEDFKIRN